MVEPVSDGGAADTGGGGGGGVSGGGSRRDVPTVGPRARLRRVSRNGVKAMVSSGSSGCKTMYSGRRGACHGIVTARMSATTWSSAVRNQARPTRRRGTWRSNSGEHLSQPLRRLDEARRPDGER